MNGPLTTLHSSRLHPCHRLVRRDVRAAGPRPPAGEEDNPVADTLPAGGSLAVDSLGEGSLEEGNLGEGSLGVDLLVAGTREEDILAVVHQAGEDSRNLQTDRAKRIRNPSYQPRSRGTVGSDEP